MNISIKSLFTHSLLSIPFILTACGSGGGSSNNENITNAALNNLTLDSVKTADGVISWGAVPVVVVNKKLNEAELAELKNVLSNNSGNYNDYNVDGRNYSRIAIHHIGDNDADYLAYTGKPTTEKLANLKGQFRYLGKYHMKGSVTTEIDSKQQTDTYTVDNDNIAFLVDFDKQSINFDKQAPNFNKINFDKKRRNLDTNQLNEIFSYSNEEPEPLNGKIYQDGKHIAFKAKRSKPIDTEIENVAVTGSVTTSLEGKFMGPNAQELAGKQSMEINVKGKLNNHSKSVINIKSDANAVFWAEKQ